MSLLNEYNQSLTETSKIFGKGLTFISIRVAPNFLLSFTGFLDDLWYYRYHRNQYPQSVRFFMEKIDLINELRLNPWFLDFLDVLSQPLVCNESNQRMLEYLNFTGEDPQSVYFLHSAEDTYKSNLVMNVAFLVAMKALYLLALRTEKCMKDRGEVTNLVFRTVLNLLKYSSAWWSIVVAIF